MTRRPPSISPMLHVSASFRWFPTLVQNASQQRPHLRLTWKVGILRRLSPLIIR